jgi:hypothetical protein
MINRLLYAKIHAECNGSPVFDQWGDPNTIALIHIAIRHDFPRKMSAYTDFYGFKIEVWGQN